VTSLAPPRPPWEKPELFAVRPEEPPYGYVVVGVRHGCDREELIARCRAHSPHVDVVWVPDFPRLVPPAEVPWLLDAVLARTRRNLRYNLLNGLALLAIWSTMAGIYFLSGMPLPLLAVIVFMLGVVPVAQPAAGLWRLRQNPVGYAREQAGILRYQMWLGTRRAAVTWGLGICLIAVGAAQVYVGTRAASLGSSMAVTAPVAGLVKPAVDAGQAWRLLTCELMHGHPLHFAFNFFALLALGRLLEMHGHPAYLPTVFLFSALCASTFSYYLTPATSVGASGGIMGMVGFLAVIGVRRRHVVPRGFLKSIALSVALTAGTGLVAHQFVDNAAHGGGLLGGLMLGAVYVTRRSVRPKELRLSLSGLGKFAAAVCAVAIVVATAATVWLLLAATRG
jgi:membrane associated rhomboid family serine protease